MYCRELMVGADAWDLKLTRKPRLNHFLINFSVESLSVESPDASG